MSKLVLPWLRRGLSRGIGDVDTRDGVPLALRGTIDATIELVDSEGTTDHASKSLSVAGPGDVVGFDVGQVVRREPPDGAADVETNFFPFIELLSPDLPWMLTPARADADNAVRPWVVLVCVEERDGVAYDAAAVPLPVLRVDGELVEPDHGELPDLAESWAWAHVQSLVDGREIEGAVTAGTGSVIARLLCPRRLLADRSYRACLVPAFEAGRLAGLGLPADLEMDLRPAWPRHDAAAVLELPVYDSWTFTTATEAGDFEELARRLEPDLDGGRLGYRPAHVVDNGLLPPFGADTSFEYAGALVTPNTSAERLPTGAGRWFRRNMTTRLVEAASRKYVRREEPAGYDPETDDPVVGPPLYGRWAAGRHGLIGERWLAEANLVTDRRAAAGLGAEVVRRHQTELLAAAWDQAGDVMALRDELNRGRLAAEVGRSHARRFGALDDPDLLSVTGRLHCFSGVGTRRAALGERRASRVPKRFDTPGSPGGPGDIELPGDRPNVPWRTTATLVANSVVVPTAMTSACYLRRARRGSVLARRAGSTEGPAVGRRAVERFIAASVNGRDASLESVARFGAAFAPATAVTSFTEWHAVGTVDVTIPTSIADGDIVPLHASAPIDSDASDVTGAARTVRVALDPMPAIVAGLAARIGGVAFDVRDDLPTQVQIGARFPQPLFSWLHALGSEVVLPGIDDFGANRVRLLEVNEAWLAAFLVGANHEWAREALWNEYPADLGATSFSSFWDRIPTGTPDIAEDIHLWTRRSTLASHVGTDGGSAVLLVRGDVVRRYPDAEMFLVTPGPDGKPLDADDTIPEERITWPAFSGYLDRQTIFVGFDVDAGDIRDEGRYIAIQEPEAGPRFGLDSADPAHHGVPPRTWSELSWGHMAADADSFDNLTHVRLATARWLDGEERDDLTWARNSGHQAAITFQTPFRLLVLAEYLMPETAEDGP